MSMVCYGPTEDASVDIQMQMLDISERFERKGRRKTTWITQDALSILSLSIRQPRDHKLSAYFADVHGSSLRPYDYAGQFYLMTKTQLVSGTRYLTVHRHQPSVRRLLSRPRRHYRSLHSHTLLLVIDATRSPVFLTQSSPKHDLTRWHHL